MNFEAQIDKLKKKYEEIEPYKEDKDEEFILFNKLLNEKQAEDLLHYCSEDYIIALFSANTNIDFNTIKNAIHNNMNLFKKGYMPLYSISFSIAILVDNIGCDKLIKSLNSSGTSIDSSLKKHFYRIKNAKKCYDNIENFIKLFDLDINNVCKCLTALINMKSLRKDLKFYNGCTKFAHKAIPNKKKRDDCIKKIRNNQKIDDTIKKIIEPYKEIKNYGHNIAKQASLKEKKCRRKIEAYANIIEWLTQNKESKKIHNIPKQLYKIDEELQLEILREICKLNQKYYNSLAEEYKKLSIQNKENIAIIFRKFGIHINENEIGTNIDVNNLENILSMITKMKITDQNLIIKVINETPLENIEKLYDLYQRGAISTNFISKNLESILERFSIFINNINLISDNNFSNSSIKSIESVLLEDTSKLIRNFNILKEYNLFNSKKIASNPNLLDADDLNIRIDAVLELGYESYLIDNLYLLNLDPTIFKRLIVLRRLNIELQNPEQLYNILTNSKFVVKDDDLDNYIYIESIHKEELEDLSKDDFMTMLESFKNTERTYNFNGVIISSNKIKIILFAPLSKLFLSCK